jgi:hypothetical protein
MKNVVFWEDTPCGYCKNRRFGGTYRLHHRSDKNRRTRNNVSRNSLHSVRRLLVRASVVPTSPIPVILTKEALRSYETLVLTRATRRNIPEDAFFRDFRKSTEVRTFQHGFDQVSTIQQITVYFEQSNFSLTARESL